MGRCDRGHNGDVGADLSDQAAYFAGVIHADLEHTEGGLSRHSGQAKRHAPMIIIRSRGGGDFALAPKRLAQHLLCRRFSRAARDGNNTRPATRARGAPQSFQGTQRIVDEEYWCVLVELRRRIADKGCGGALFQCRYDKIVAVAVLSLERNE